MKKIVIKTVKKLMDDIDVDEPTQELLLNNIGLYNTLLSDFQKGERHNAYLLYQLNNAIQKEIESIKKHNKVIDKDKNKFEDFKEKFKK